MKFLNRFGLRIEKKSYAPPAAFSVFMTVKNEAYSLPFFFEHYRQLGVSCFVVFDDASDDGSREYLMAQDDCMVLSSERKFGEVVGAQPNGAPLRYGSAIRLLVPQLLVKSGWMLVVDADEFLLLPKGFRTLSEVAIALEAKGQSHLTAPMVDFYPRTLQERNFDRRLSPFVGSPYFDAGPLYDWFGRVKPKPFVSGIRLRLLASLVKHAPQELSAIYGSHPRVPAKTWKVPMIKHGEGIFRLNEHEINRVPDLGFVGTLAHFKFTPGLDGKIIKALETGAYYNASMEYRFLESAIRHFDSQSLLGPLTRVYRGVDSLVEAQHNVGT